MLGYYFFIENEGFKGKEECNEGIPTHIGIFKLFVHCFCKQKDFRLYCFSWQKQTIALTHRFKPTICR